MKYNLNNQVFKINLQQPTICENQLEIKHTELIKTTQRWYSKGYTSMAMPAPFFLNIRQKTASFIIGCVNEALGIKLTDLKSYHSLVTTTEQHLRVLEKIGKLINPETLGIDVKQLEVVVKMTCGTSSDLTCNGWSDIRIFRPFSGTNMDNNPLHRDTWVPIIKNCVNIYLPIVGNNRYSSLSLIPGSHLWDGLSVDRTVNNAKVNGTVYGLPAVSKINRPYIILRPKLSSNDALLFSSHLLHGGAVNLNKDTTRVSIEMRFWPKQNIESNLSDF